MNHVIPEGSIEIQTGLFLYEYTTIIAGTEYTLRQLYSAEGYCFWQVSDIENYYYNEETGEQLGLKPLEERIFAQYSALAIGHTSWTYDQLNAEFISVPVQDNFNILHNPNPPVEA